MIDLNKKYTLKNGSEVHLFEILNDTVYGRYYDKCSLKWYLGSWNVDYGYSKPSTLSQEWDLIEVPTFKIERIIVKEMKHQNYLGVGLYVPSTVNYIAVSSTGRIYGFQTEPVIRTDISVYGGQYWYAYHPDIYLGRCEYSGDWKNSLVKLQ